MRHYTGSGTAGRGDCTLEVLTESFCVFLSSGITAPKGEFKEVLLSVVFKTRKKVSSVVNLDRDYENLAQGKERKDNVSDHRGINGKTV